MGSPYNSTDNPNPNGKQRGRIPVWNDINELQEAIDNYFNECDKTIIIKQYAHSKGITKVETPTPYTMAGLARALGIARETLNNYQTASHQGHLGDEEKQKIIRDIITRARDRVHEQNLNLALIGCHDSRIAALNLASNYGYSTKEEIHETGEKVIRVIYDGLGAGGESEKAD